jgi:purine-binding chemotaxis protein CheW
MAIGLEQAGETFGLVVDGVGEVLKLGPDTHEAVPINLDARWRNLALGVHRLDGKLLVILDVDGLLSFGAERAEASAA